MQDKKKYRLDEIALREKFANYHVDFNPACLEFLEDEVAQVKTHAPIELPDTKKILRFLIIPLVLVTIGCAAFFTYNYVKNLPESSNVKDTTITKTIAQPKVEIQPKQEIKSAAVIDTIKTESLKKDTLMPTLPALQKTKTAIKIMPPQKINVQKQDTISGPRINSTQIDSVKKKNKTDTTSVLKNRDTFKKKKKKRRNSLDATEDIRQSEPNSADDDVVVPNN